MKKIGTFVKNYCGTFFIIGGFIFFYSYGTTHGIITSFLFPAPEKIWLSFQIHHMEILEGMVYSFQLLIPSLVLSTLIALLIGIPMGLSRKLHINLHPIIHALGVIPIILIPPYAVHIFASFKIATIFIVVYGSVWGTLFATITGVQTVNKRFLDTALALEIKGLEKLFRVILPAAMPTILSGFVTSLRVSFLVLIYAEMFSVKNGMGRFIQSNTLTFNYTNVMTGTIFLVIVVIIVMLIFEKLKDRVLHWTISSK